MRIHHRLALGFFSCMVLTCIVGAIGWFCLQTYSREVAETTRLGELTGRLNGIATQIERYDQTGEPAQLQSARAEVGRLIEGVDAGEDNGDGTLLAVDRAFDSFAAALGRFADLDQESRTRID